MTKSTLPPGIGKGQLLHFACLTVLLSLLGFAWSQLDKPVPTVFWIAAAFPVVHQIFVWLAWRLELRSAETSKTIGFGAYVSVFFVPFFGRFMSLGVLGWYDIDSLKLPLKPRVILTGLLLVPALYAAYSMQRYFGMVWAAGADHFDPSYREMPLVKQGIFRFTDNGMYFYAFLSFRPSRSDSIPAPRWRWPPSVTPAYGFISTPLKGLIWNICMVRGQNRIRRSLAEDRSSL